MAVIWMLIPTSFPPDDSQFEGFKYACYIRYMEPCVSGSRSATL